MSWSQSTRRQSRLALLPLAAWAGAVTVVVETGLRAGVRIDRLCHSLGVELDTTRSRETPERDPSGGDASSEGAGDDTTVNNVVDGLLSHRDPSATPAESPGSPDPRVAARLRATRAVLRRWPFGDTCLKRSLVLGALLHSHEPRLKIGIARDVEPGRSSVVAHAWLETTAGTFGSDGRWVPLVSG